MAILADRSGARRSREGGSFRIVVYSFFGYGVFTLLLVMAIFLTSSHAHFVSAYDAYFQGGVAKVFSDAAAAGYSPGANLANLGAIVPLLFVSIGPYPVMQFVGGGDPGGRGPRSSTAWCWRRPYR